MRFLDLTLPTAAENLALDEALLLAAERDGGEVLRFWEPADYAVILGSSCRLAEEVNEAACVADGVPILRRCSGGGTVLLGPGCLCFSLVLAFERAAPLNDVTHSYAHILGRIRDALLNLVPGIVHAGKSDLAIGDRKFSGNSQRRMRTHLLHHGTILHGFELARIEYYSKMPTRQPEYRRQRRHVDFLVNLPAGGESIKSRLRERWQADSPTTGWPQNEVAMLCERKYSQAEWTRRR